MLLIKGIQESVQRRSVNREQFRRRADEHPHARF
jgi:hypothetical protein